MRLVTNIVLTYLLVVLPALPMMGANEDFSFLFQRNKVDVDLSVADNVSAIQKLDLFLDYCNKCGVNIVGMTLEGTASPEGAAAYNRRLSAQRAQWLVRHVDSRLVDKTDIPVDIKMSGRDWGRLAYQCASDSVVLATDGALALLQSLAASETDEAETASFKRLREADGGRLYAYLFDAYFYGLRTARLTIAFDSPVETARALSGIDCEFPSEPIAAVTTPTVERQKKPFYLAIKTNMLYDALGVPNGGFEAYLGKQWSLTAMWGYAWYKCDHRHNYWRIYGGDAEVRRWFGKAAKAKPLTGHHLGVYGQMLTYDFELGGRGYLADKWSYAAGVSYGYSLPVARRLNIDFSLGVGYMGGKFKEYIPDEGCYVWQSTKQRHWIGPTKLEITLVWLIGRGNVNRKGGRR